jgi:hypothetical protein
MKFVRDSDSGAGPSKAARSSETLVNFYQTTRRYNPEDSHLRTNRRENLNPLQICSGDVVRYRKELLKLQDHIERQSKKIFIRDLENAHRYIL